MKETNKKPTLFTEIWNMTKDEEQKEMRKDSRYFNSNEAKIFA